MANPRLKLVGMQFGRLSVIKCVGIDDKGGTIWACKCSCGNEKIVASAHLRNGATKSCGCYRSERMTTHGMSLTPFWNIWSNLLFRCYDERCKDYKHYGGRGIVACEAIRATPHNLFLLLGDRPDGLTLDRKNNNEGYTCGDCKECKQRGWKMNLRWATRSEQGFNQRRSRQNRDLGPYRPKI